MSWPPCCIALSLVGFLDDRYNLPSLWRYIAQLITAVLVIIVSPLVDLSSINVPLFFLMLISITAVINFSNFMDGLDGLVAGCMFIAILLLLFIFLPHGPFGLSWWFAGFFALELESCKVFMGDVGTPSSGQFFH